MHWRQCYRCRHRKATCRRETKRTETDVLPASLVPFELLGQNQASPNSILPDSVTGASLSTRTSKNEMEDPDSNPDTESMASTSCPGLLDAKFIRERKLRDAIATQGLSRSAVENEPRLLWEDNSFHFSSILTMRRYLF